MQYFAPLPSALVLPGPAVPNGAGGRVGLGVEERPMTTPERADRQRTAPMESPWAVPSLRPGTTPNTRQGASGFDFGGM